MSYVFEIKRFKSKFLGQKAHLLIRTQDGRIVDHFPGVEKGIKKASLLDLITLQGKMVILNGKAYQLKNKSLNKYLIRNGTRLSFDRYSSKIHMAVSKGLRNALRFLPEDNLNKAEMRGKILLKCVDHYCNPCSSQVCFPYDKELEQFKKNYRDPLKWETFFINLWKSRAKA